MKIKTKKVFSCHGCEHSMLTELCPANIAYRSFVSWCWGGEWELCCLSASCWGFLQSSLMQKDSMLGSDLSMVETWHITGYKVQLVGSTEPRDLQGLWVSAPRSHWGRVLENLLKDQVQQCINTVCSAINKKYIYRKISLQPKSLVLQCCKVSLISPNSFLFIPSPYYLFWKPS